MKGQAAQFSTRELIRVVKLFHQAGLDVKASAQPQLSLELAFVEATMGEEEKATPSAPGPSSGAIPKPSAGIKMASAPPSSPTGQSAKTVREKATGEPRATSTGLELTLDTVNSQWGRILDQVKLENRSVEALLKSCEPLGVEGQEVVLGFYYPFHKEKIEEFQNKALVESAVSRVVERSCHIRCVLSPKGERRTPSLPEPVQRPQKATVEKQDAPKDKFSSIADDPLVQEAVSKYGARVVDVQ
jgi:DNA polymerase-3 subunit gamma/tau